MLYEKYKDQVAFYAVYIKEAHPTDGWQLWNNVQENVVFADPKSAGEREHVAGLCVVRLGIKFPALVDDMQNKTETDFTGWPDRLYVIDRDGRVAFKSDPGPFGFDPSGVEQTLAHLIPSKKQ